MTTGIDYDTQFIGMKPDENTPSILELLEEECKHGYSNMSDNDIARLIRYKQYFATKEAVNEYLTKENELKTEELKLKLIEIANSIIKSNEPVEFKRVGENNGQE